MKETIILLIISALLFIVFIFELLTFLNTLNILLFILN